MKAFVTCALLLAALPASAQDFEQLTFNASPAKAYEAGMEEVDGAPGRSTFLHALIDGDTRRQAAELVIWKDGKALKGKKLRVAMRLKSSLVGRSGCSMAAWDATHVIKSADGPVFGGNASWADCSVVMAIPEDATRVQVRYYLQGSGKVWSDGFHVEEVGADVPETRRNQSFDRNSDSR